MLLTNRIARVAGRAFFGAAMLSVSAVSLVSLTHPAAAAAVFAAVQSAVTCASTGTTPCVSGTNTSSGIGVEGTSNTGTGLRGSSNTNFGLKATSTSSNGVEGISTSNFGVYGQTKTGFAGVAGTSADNYGVYGYATGSGTGVYGSGGGGNGVSGASGSGYGVFGSTSSSFGGAGVAGQAFSGYGVYGYTTTSTGGYGVVGSSSNGYGVYGTTSTGTGTAVYGYESGTGNAVLGISSRYAVVGVSGEDPLVLENASGTAVAFVNSAGDFYYHGGLHSFAKTASGATVDSFSPKTASPTVEDTGTAQLVGGVAAVRLDPTFAATIDSTTPYRVFITPDGDTPHGLFVATKTAAGFIVREAQSGHSTVSFDYRIVASALGQAGQRMAVVNAALMPHVALPAVEKLPQGAAQRH